MNFMEILHFLMVSVMKSHFIIHIIGLMFCFVYNITIGIFKGTASLLITMSILAIQQFW